MTAPACGNPNCICTGGPHSTCKRSAEIEASRRGFLLSFSDRPDPSKTATKSKPVRTVQSVFKGPTKMIVKGVATTSGMTQKRPPAPPKPLPTKPGYLIGCYVLHPYCGCDAHDEFSGETLVQAIKEARRRGWTIVGKRGDLVRCPSCTRKAKPVPEPTLKEKLAPLGISPVTYHQRTRRMSPAEALALGPTKKVGRPRKGT